MVLKDQMGRKIHLDRKPVRVVSLVPSITEFLIDLGAEVVGRTKFCIHPSEKVTAIPVIGGTKKFDFSKIRALKPDLIVGNKEENYPEGIALLEKDFPVWMSQVITLDDAVDLMTGLGQVLGLDGDYWAGKFRETLARTKNTASGSVLYFIWKDPWMVAGPETYIHSYLHHLGYQNAISKSRYPKLSIEQLSDLQPDTVLLSSEPYPFKAKHLEEVQEMFPYARIRMVNGEVYSWYGTRFLNV